MPTAPVLPLVFFPGAGGRLTLLKRLAERLARRRTAIICEYPGLGDATADPGLLSLDDLQRQLLQSLPDRFDLVAKSMGCSLALRIALAEPLRIRKLVLLATSGGVNVARLGGLDWRDMFHTLQPQGPRWFVEDRTELSERLGEVTQPTLLVFGDADSIAPVRVGEFLLERLKDARLEVIPEATHDLEGEFPDLVASLIEAHLRRP